MIYQLYVSLDLEKMFTEINQSQPVKRKLWIRCICETNIADRFDMLSLMNIQNINFFLSLTTFLQLQSMYLHNLIVWNDTGSEWDVIHCKMCDSYSYFTYCMSLMPAILRTYSSSNTLFINKLVTDNYIWR